MSAYVVAKETIDNAVQAIANDQFRSIQRDWVGHTSIMTVGELEKIGQELLDLNVLAVKGRYPELSEDELPGEIEPQRIYTNTYSMCSPIQAYKSVQCLHYQCSEAPAVDHPTYAKLTKLCNHLAHRIAQSHEYYEKAIWG